MLFLDWLTSAGNAQSDGIYSVSESWSVTLYGGAGNVPSRQRFGCFPYPLILATDSSFGVQNDEFGFSASWATNLSVVIEASTNLAESLWEPLRTNTLLGGTCYFSDPLWTNYPRRFYRVKEQ